MIDAWSLAAAASTFLVYIASFLAVGLSLFRLALPGGGAVIAGTLRSLAVMATLVAGAASVFRVAVQAGQLMGEWSGMIDPAIVMISLDGSLGRSTFVRLAGLGLILYAALCRPFRMSMTLTGAVMVAVSFALTGHATREPQWLLGSAVTVHVLAVAYWFGALIPLALLTRQEGAPGLAAATADRFGRQAIIMVPLLVLAGAGFALLTLGSVEALWMTGYGRMLLAKVAFVACVLGIAACNKLRFVPALAAGEPHAGRTFRRSLVIEAIAFLSVFAATALLTTSFAVPVAS